MMRMNRGTIRRLVGHDLGHNDLVETIGAAREGRSRAEHAAGPVAADIRTRDRVARLLLELGPSTAAALGSRLGLSSAAVRRHLDAMTADGTILARDARTRGPRGRGRPARAYALTDAGHAAGPSAYDELARGALRFLAEQGGSAAVGLFAADRADQLADRLAEQMPASTGAAGQAPALANALTHEGYAATVHEVATGAQLCQHHCPVASVAEEFPQLCEAETAALSRLLDTHVQRLATIAHGDGVCTLHIPHAHGPHAAPTTSAPTTSTPAPAAAGASFVPRKGSS